MNILVIEDDKRIARLLERGLTENGHQVFLAHDGKEGADMMLDGKCDVALLDLYLPKMDGFEVLEKVRGRRCKMPVLVLTAVDSVPNILEAFDLGADDYLIKPFLLEILLARVSAIARRALPAIEPQAIQAGDITLDRSRRLAIRHGRQIYLTRKQFDLLELLMKRSGLITSREQLIEAGWGSSEVKESTLDVYIHGLRAKLEDKTDDEDHILIRTIHRSGYMFVEN